MQCETVIISGGVRNYLDGYYYIEKAGMNALYGQASQFLKYAIQSQEALDAFAKTQTEGLIMARSFLKIKA
jgi:isopentenyl-diphosphate delta-isomerase